MHKPASVDDHIAHSQGECKKRLRELKNLIEAHVPAADQGISYGMPAHKLTGKPFIYFYGYDKHIGMYPGRVEDYSFNKELQKYASGKSTLKFPHDQPFPTELIKSFIDHRLKELITKGKA